MGGGRLSPVAPVVRPWAIAVDERRGMSLRKRPQGWGEGSGWSPLQTSPRDRREWTSSPWTRPRGARTAFGDVVAGLAVAGVEGEWVPPQRRRSRDDLGVFA